MEPPSAHIAQPALSQQQIRRLEIDRRSRVLKDLLHLRPVRHWTERRVRARVAVCVYATVVEALMGPGAAAGDVRDPETNRMSLQETKIG